MDATRDREKKQLEEIAHLYFSSPPQPAKKKAGDPPPGLLAQGRPLRLLSVCCRSAPAEQKRAFRLLLNLAVLLKIADEPALWISPDPGVQAGVTGSPRFLGRRLIGMASVGLPWSYCGPMGIRYVAGLDPRGKKACLDSLQSGGTGQSRGRAPYAYVLWSGLAGLGPFEGLVPQLDLFVLSASTPRTAFPPSERGKSSVPCQAGMVALGVQGGEEAETLFLDWGKRLRPLYENELEPEGFGFLPAGFGANGAGAGQRVEVLEDPLSWQTRCLQQIAARLRQKRAEMLGGD
ncbi:MAG: hypothetical protein AB1640_14395 [bacterium]